MTSRALGRAASLLAVVNAIRNGSRIAFTKVRNGTRMIHDGAADHQQDEQRQRAVHHQHELAERDEDAEALAAHRVGDRREHARRRELHHVARELEHHLGRGLHEVVHRLAVRPTAASAMPKNVAKTTICRMSPFAIASKMEVGNRCRKMSHGALLVRRELREVARVAAGHGHACARLEHVDRDEADQQRHRRRHLEPDDGLQPDASHRLQVAHAGDADDEGREQQRRDDHLDHAQEGVGDRLDARADVRQRSTRARCRGTAR